MPMPPAFVWNGFIGSSARAGAAYARLAANAAATRREDHEAHQGWQAAPLAPSLPTPDRWLVCAHGAGAVH